MHEAIARMLSKYECEGLNDYINALREILQEVALLGLWRSKFFEKGALYGGTALRILYGLDRFSAGDGKVGLRGETGMTSCGTQPIIPSFTSTILSSGCAKPDTGEAMHL